MGLPKEIIHKDKQKELPYDSYLEAYPVEASILAKFASTDYKTLVFKDPDSNKASFVQKLLAGANTLETSL